MKLHYNDLIDRYNYGQLTDEEKELFYLSLEYSKKLRDEFTYHLMLKAALDESEIYRVERFLTENRLKDEF